MKSFKTLGALFAIPVLSLSLSGLAMAAETTEGAKKQAESAAAPTQKKEATKTQGGTPHGADGGAKIPMKTDQPKKADAKQQNNTQ